MSKSWQEVQTLLDDPFVDADTKEHLLAAYIKESVAGYPYITEDDLPDDVRGYYDRYPIRGGDFDQGSLDDIYEDARAESEERGYSAGLTQDAIDRNTSTLTELQAPQEGQSSGVESSDEIFELARPALKVFENFLPVNDKVPGDSLGRYGKIALEDVTARFEEQLGISFRKFLDDAARLRVAYRRLSELSSTTESELNGLYRSWSGPAANSSYRFYAERIAPSSSDLIDYLSEGPGMIDTLVANVFAECKAKADTVMGLYQPTVGSATPDIAMKVVELAGSADDRGKILEVAAWVDSVCGSDIENTIRDDDCGLNDENKEYVRRECKKWIRDSFNQDLHESIYATFKQACDDALEAVDSYYEELNSYLGEYENGFGDASAAAPPAAPPGAAPGGGPGGGGSYTPPPSAGGGGGSTMPAGGGAPPVSTPPSSASGGSGSGGGGSVAMPDPPTPPEIPTPPGSTDPSGTGGDDAGQDPGGVPPGTSPTTPGQEETVTIDDGDRSISVTSPDGQGQVKVTVDDGSGHPKTYTLDFGEGDTPAAGAAGLPATPGQAGSVGTGGSGAPDLDEPIRPGEDGRCVVHDGDLTITAERPEGSADTVVVTVDDGTGEPTTYNLDYSGADGPAATPHDGEAQAVYRRLDDRLDGVIGDLDQQQAGQGAQPGVDRGAVGPLDRDPAGQYATEPGSVVRDPAGAAPGVDPDAPGPLDRDPAGRYGEPAFAATSAQASLTPDGGGFFADPDGGAAGHAGSFGVPDHGRYAATDDPGEAGLATAGDGDNGGTGGQHTEGRHAGGAMGGMPMMGGAGGGTSGDQDRTTGAQWRTTGDLFDDEADTRLRGAFGEGRQ